MRLLAVDPGELYIGAAVYHGWECLQADTILGAAEAVDRFWREIEDGRYDVVVSEQWRNFDAQVTWSEVRTVEVIGALRHKCRQQQVPFFVQPSAILRPGRARMAAHGLQVPDLSHITPAKNRTHAENAVVHGAWHLFEVHSPTKENDYVESMRIPGTPP